ncbi:MAG: hypothetical protein KAS32_14905 [Candidatus Peribacteraceae bacterium]|nr:hypothetical protein [Candidatus Peribacteraceae bacterium]
MSIQQIPEKLEQRLLKETKADMLEIMIEAIDSMQAYNGRSITWCIIDALGGSPREDDDGNIVSYSYPKYQRKKKNG